MAIENSKTPLATNISYFSWWSSAGQAVKSNTVEPRDITTFLWRRVLGLYRYLGRKIISNKGRGIVNLIREYSIILSS